MKTREQIYGKEAAALLRDITTYRCIKHQQLLKLYPGKERQIDSLLAHLVRQGRVFHNTDTDTYFDSPDMQTDPDMLSALWVLADFSGRTDYHSSDEFPVKLIFFAEGETCEVICLSPEKETLIEHAIQDHLHAPFMHFLHKLRKEFIAGFQILVIGHSLDVFGCMGIVLVAPV